MGNPMFSIIVPVYNTEKELERCVRSVTCQTYQDFELILVDDGSKDSSGAMCDTFSAEDSRIVAIHQQNAGSSEARNTGIRAAKGDYLLFLDSDDLWDDQNALEELQKQIAAHPADVFCFGVRIYDDDGTFVKERLLLCPCGQHVQHCRLLLLAHPLQTAFHSTRYLVAHQLLDTSVSGCPLPW